MKETNRTSRRSFLGKLAAGSMGFAISTSISNKVFAATQARSTFDGGMNPPIPFLSNKKFVPVMLTPYKQNSPA
jgi:hypothetical protein